MRCDFGPPYRDNPETFLGELSRLKALMEEFGGEKPIVVTEFGHWFDDPNDAPDYMLKMVMLMSAADVSGSYWYALREEEWWPNMGLFDLSGKLQKPAASSFSFLQAELPPLGRAERQGTDTAAYIYHLEEMGRGAVFWGSGGEVEVNGEARYFDGRGRQIEPVTNL